MTVSGIFSSSVVAIMKTTCGGGSSIDLSRALNERQRELVHFVDDEDLVAVANRHDRQAGNDDVSDVVDAGMGGGVDFQDVDVAAFGNLDARVTLAAWIGSGSFRAVQGARQYPRGRRLPDTSGAGKDERLRQPPADQRVTQRTCDRLLSNDIVEPLRTPFARENLVGHRCSDCVMSDCRLRTGPRPGVACGTFRIH